MAHDVEANKLSSFFFFRSSSLQCYRVENFRCNANIWHNVTCNASVVPRPNFAYVLIFQNEKLWCALDRVEKVTLSRSLTRTLFLYLSLSLSRFFFFFSFYFTSPVIAIYVASVCTPLVFVSHSSIHFHQVNFSLAQCFIAL